MSAYNHLEVAITRLNQIDHTHLSDQDKAYLWRARAEIAKGMEQMQSLAKDLRGQCCNSSCHLDDNLKKLGACNVKR